MAAPLREALPVFYERDADLALIRSRRVAVVGYGSQGRAQALNLRDSGVDVVIGARPGRSVEAAAADGFEVLSVAEATRSAQVVALLTSDEAHRDLWRDSIGPNLKPGAALVFAHGLSVRFGLVDPPPSTDVVLVSPKTIGPRLREIYERGGGVFGLVAVHRDASGRALDLALSFGAALGCGRAGMLRTTFAEECESDLLGEQVVLCGGVMGLIHAAFEVLTEAGHAPEVAYLECLHELKLVTDVIYARGLAGAFEKISNTAEYGAYLSGDRVIGDEARAAVRAAFADVRDGSFVRRFMADHDAGFSDLHARRAALAAHPIEAAGRRVRGLLEAALAPAESAR